MANSSSDSTIAVCKMLLKHYDYEKINKRRVFLGGWGRGALHLLATKQKLENAMQPNRANAEEKRVRCASKEGNGLERK